MSKEQLKTINQDLDLILWVLEYYNIELKEFWEMGEEFKKDYVLCKNKIHNILYLLNK